MNRLLFSVVPPKNNLSPKKGNGSNHCNALAGATCWGCKSTPRMPPQRSSENGPEDPTLRGRFF